MVTRKQGQPFFFPSYINQLCQFHSCLSLKALDTFGNCKKLVFSLSISTNALKKNCENFDSIGEQSCERIMKEKIPLLHKMCVLSHAYANIYFFSNYLTCPVPLTKLLYVETLHGEGGKNEVRRRCRPMSQC